MSTWWARTWPSLLAVAVVALVGAPAAIASYLHARDVAARHDPVMAPWLPLSVDGMLLAALVVVWVRRHRRDQIGVGPWAAFIFGMVVTVSANLAAVDTPGAEAYIVALFPPLALGIALELVALVAYRTGPEEAGPVDRTDDCPTGPLYLNFETEEWTDPWDRWSAEVVEAARTTEETANRTTPGPLSDQARTGGPGADRDALLDDVVRWAAGRTGPVSQRAVRAEFGVGASRAARLVQQLEEAS